jgi:hypothetical protein
VNDVKGLGPVGWFLRTRFTNHVVVVGAVVALFLLLWALYYMQVAALWVWGLF